MPSEASTGAVVVVVVPDAALADVVHVSELPVVVDDDIAAAARMAKVDHADEQAAEPVAADTVQPVAADPLVAAASLLDHCAL